MKQRDVAVLLLNNKGMILIEHRSKDASRLPNSWGLFGGGIDQDESPEMALRREMREETGLILKNPKIIKKYPYILKESDEQGYVYVFGEVYIEGSSIKLKDSQEMRWVYPNDALELDLNKIYKDIIKEIVYGRICMVS